MTASVLDPKLENVKRQIEGAFTGGPGVESKDYAPATSVVRDASSMASAMLSAYHVAATVNPDKAFRAKGFTPQVQIGDPSELEMKAWWDSVLSIIQHLPAQRQNDRAFADYATTLLLTLGQATVQAMSGQKDFTDSRTQVSIPQPPPGMDKGWFDDVCSFVSDAAPVALPIIMSLI